MGSGWPQVRRGEGNVAFGELLSRLRPAVLGRLGIEGPNGA